MSPDETRAYVSAVLEDVCQDMASMFAAARLDAGEQVSDMWIDRVWSGLRERLDAEQRLTAIVLLLMGDARAAADELTAGAEVGADTQPLGVDDDPVVYAPAPHGPFPGQLVKPRCYQCRKELADCPCSGATS